MSLFRTEGVILHTLNFQDYDLILSVFSPDLGVEKFFVKNAYRPSRKESAPSLIMQGEFVYRQGNGAFLICNEFFVLNHYVALRKEYATLQGACDLLRLIHRSQLPGKPAPDLYQLLLKYLNELQQFRIDPKVLCASFYLKLMRYEGYLHLSNACQKCQQPLSALYFSNGECFCLVHAPHGSAHFSFEETDLLHRLVYCRFFKELQTVLLSDSLAGKIRSEFVFLA